MIEPQISQVTKLIPGATYKLRCPKRIASNGEITSCMRMLGKIDGTTGEVVIMSKRAGLHVRMKVGTIVCEECGNRLRWDHGKT